MSGRRAARALIGLLTFLLLAIIVASHARAAGISFCNVCNGARFVAKGGDLLVICPGKTEPWMTFKGCSKPSVKKDRSGNVTIACA